MDYPELKREAIMSTITANCKEVIEQKYRMLQGRIWKVSAISAGVSAIPIPGTSLAVDSVLIAKEVQHYKNQFGLDGDSLDKLIKSNVVTREQLENLTQNTMISGALFQGVAAFVASLLVMFVGELAIEEAVGMIPIIGSFIAAPISFATTNQILNSVLDQMKDLALKLLDMTIEKNASMPDSSN